MDTNKKQKVLLIRLSSLGDCIFNIPLANALKEGKYEVSWLVGEKGIDVIKNNPCIDRVFFAPIEKWKKNKNLFQNVSEFLQIIKKIRKENFDISLDTQMLMKSILWNLFSGAKRRIVSKDAREFSFLGANEIMPPIKDKFNRPIVKCFLKFAEYLGVSVDTIKVTIPPSDEDTTNKVNHILKDINISKKILAIAPTTTWAGKHWDKENWKNLIKNLPQNYNIIFIGTSKDYDYIEYIRSGIGINLAGQTTIKDLIEIFNRTDLLISLDNGATHLAWATQKPKILSIFCCTPNTLYAPLESEKYISVSGNLACQPCHHRKCKNKNKYECTKFPAPEFVLEKINELAK